MTQQRAWVRLDVLLGEVALPGLGALVLQLDTGSSTSEASALAVSKLPSTGKNTPTRN